MKATKGFRDYSGQEAQKRELIKQVFIKNFRLFNFEPAETPVIEYENFVKSDSQDEVISDIFRLQDKGKRKLALRYEFTFQLKRLARNKKLPYRRYQIGPVFRDEPVSKNRFRQFTQCDVDIIGSTAKDEAEILALTSKILKDLNIKFTIYINNRKLLNEILNENKIKNKEKVIREIDKLDKLPEAKVKNNLKKLKAENILKLLKKPESYFKKYNSYKEIQELKKYCKYYNINLKFSPSLARGLSYYNSTVFEIKTPKIKETICGGGSYLVNKIQSTGISFGLERISQLAKIKLENNSILIISLNQDEKAIKIAGELRNKNINCSIIYGKPTKALNYANSKKIPYILIIGKKELEKNKLRLKNMETGKEKLITLKELIYSFYKTR